MSEAGKAKMRLIHTEAERLLNQIAALFPVEYKLTLVARNTTNPQAHRRNPEPPAIACEALCVLPAASVCSQREGDESVSIHQEILSIPMGYNDAEAKTIREYLVTLLKMLWKDGEGFSGKRPFGNGGWEWDIYRALANAGKIAVEKYEDGEVKNYDTDAANALILGAIDSLFIPPFQIPHPDLK